MAKKKGVPNEPEWIIGRVYLPVDDHESVCNATEKDVLDRGEEFASTIVDGEEYDGYIEIELTAKKRYVIHRKPVEIPLFEEEDSDDE